MFFYLCVVLKGVFIMSIQPINYCNNCFAPAPRRLPTQDEIFKEKDRIDAEKAKAKPAEERTVSDKIAIVADGINKLTTNIPVKHSNNINYLS